MINVRRFLPFTMAAVALLGLPGSPRTFLLPAPSVARAAADEVDAADVRTKAAVDKALAWLARNQKPDGSWECGGVLTTSIPSLAVMAFIAGGHNPGQGPYGDTINKAIDYVLSQQQPDGPLTGSHGNGGVYEHGISMTMLAQVFSSADEARKAKIEKALAKAVKLIVGAQRPRGKPKNMPHTGGLRYTRNSDDSDISVTGWQIEGLHGAASCGIDVPKETLDAARDFVLRCAVPKDAGGFTYQAGSTVGANPQRTGAGIVSLELLAEHNSPEAIAGGDYLLEHPLNNPKQPFYYYGVYYVSQAFGRLGGKYWDIGYPKLRDALLAAQDDKGIWPDGAAQEGYAGDAYSTSMAALALCVKKRP